MADPGWSPVLRKLYLAALLPLPMVAIRRGWVDGLTGLRLLVLANPVALLVVWSVLMQLSRSGDELVSSSLALAIVGGVAAYAYIALAFLRRRMAEVQTGPEAATHFRNTTLLTIAFSNSVALTGFVLAFVSGSLVPFYVGLAAWIPGILWALPTRRSIASRQSQLGQSIDLTAALVAGGGASPTG